MLSSSSTGGEEDSSHHHQNTSAGGSTSSSDHYPAYPPLFPNPKTKTMEEVWKDINLSSLHDHCPATPGGGGDHHHHQQQQHHNHNHNHSHHHRRHHQNHQNQDQNFIFQDFFSRPFDHDPLPPPRFPPSPVVFPAAARASPLPTHATFLSLHSGGPAGFNNDFQQDDVVPGSHRHQEGFRPPAASHLQSSEYPTSFNNTPPFDDALDCSASLPLSFHQKRRVQDSDDSSAGGDRRHKRMIKNRESAARSRARKQAYTNELELEVQHLLSENAKLKKQQEELRVAAASSQVAKKSTLFRTSTAPF